MVTSQSCGPVLPLLAGYFSIHHVALTLDMAIHNLNGGTQLVVACLVNTMHDAEVISPISLTEGPFLLWPDISVDLHCIQKAPHLLLCITLYILAVRSLSER